MTSQNLSSDQIIAKAFEGLEHGDTTLFKFVTIKTGMLDEVAPLTTENGIDMRFDLAKDLTIGALLISAMGWLDEESKEALVHGISDFLQKIWEASEELGMGLPEPPKADDLLPSWDDDEL